MEITINVTGLDKLAEAIYKLASLGDGLSLAQHCASVGQVAPEQQATPVQQVIPVQQATPEQQVTQLQPATPTVQPATTVQTSTATYSIDDLARAAMTLMDAGRQADLQQLLVGYGVESLPQLPLEQYGLFATALRGMGAQI